jgi:uncharacterized protein YaaR (DUF327 family)
MCAWQSQACLEEGRTKEADERRARQKQEADERINKHKESFLHDFDAENPQGTLHQVLGLVEQLHEEDKTLNEPQKKHLVLRIFKEAVQNYVAELLSPQCQERWALTLVKRVHLPLY